MKITEKLQSKKVTFSFEFFPPRNGAEAEGLVVTVEELKGLEPDFVSVTYPLDRNRRHLTIETVIKIHQEDGLTAMAHLTCIDSTREEIGVTLELLKLGGVDNILALRGDNPGGRGGGDFRYASDLVKFIAHDFPFCIGGAAHPEKHPESRSVAEDLENLAKKVDEGCQFLITQLFFENRFYYRLLEGAARKGIQAPILAGIMPVTSVAGIKRMTALNDSTIPEPFLAALERVEKEKEQVESLGIAFAKNQIEELIREGCPGVHFYTLNKSKATREILSGLRSGGVC